MMTMNQELPEDVLIEIFLRLPVKSLYKFCCVSRTWCDLINSRDFADMHLRHVKNHNKDYHHRVVLVQRYIHEECKTLSSFHAYQDDGDSASLSPALAPDLELPSSHPGFINLYGTCNGIVCFAELMMRESAQDKIYLCNPATRRYLTLPPSTPVNLDDICNTSLGFGFDPSTKDYKVVKFTNCHIQEYDIFPEINAVEIYQLQTNSWRRLDKPPPPIACLFPCQKFSTSLLNGSLMHWCAFSPSDGLDGILSFNICSDTFHKLEFPCDLNGSPNLAVLNHSLAFILIKKHRLSSARSSDGPSISVYECSIDIWVMMEYGIKESWIKKFSIEPFSLSRPEAPLFTAPLCSWNDDIFLLQTDCGSLISCSLKNNNCREICRYDCDNHLKCPQSIVYEETLVSLAEIGKGLSWKKMGSQDKLLFLTNSLKLSQH